MLEKIANKYNSNAKFHSFVIAVEYAAVSFVTSYGGGMPTQKSGWVALGGAFVGAVIGATKRWLATNVATQGLNLK